MADLHTVAPAFVAMAHRIVWCTVATVDADGRPHTRVLHPIWGWDEDSGRLLGWVLTSPQSPKARHLAANPNVSLTYWDATQDTCTADATAAWEDDPEDRRNGWSLFASIPEPLGYDPRRIPGWTDPEVASFGVLRLEPHRLRVMPGTLLTQGTGTLLVWSAGT